MNLFQNILDKVAPNPKSTFLSGFNQPSQTQAPTAQVAPVKPKMTLFKDEYTMLGKMKADGLDDNKAMDLLKQRRTDLLEGNTKLDQKEQEMLLKMQADNLSAKEATALIKQRRADQFEKKYQEGNLAQKGAYNALMLGAGATEKTLKYAGNILDFATFGKLGFGEDVKRMEQVTQAPEFDSTARKVGSYLPDVALAVSPLGGSYLAGAKGMGNLALRSGVVGAGFGATQPIMEKGSDATIEDIATGGAKGAGLGIIATPIVSKTLKYGQAGYYGGFTGMGKSIARDTKAGIQAITPSGANISTRANRFNANEIREFKRMTGESPGEFATSRGMTKTGDDAVVEATRLWQASKDQADEGLKAIKGRFKYTDSGEDLLKTTMDDLETRLINTKSPDAKRISQLKAKYEDSGLTMSEINEVKRAYANNYKYSFVDVGSEPAIRSRNLQDAIRKWQFKVAEENGLTNLKEINKTTQGWKTFADSLGKKLVGSSGNNALSLTDAVMLSGGNLENIALYLGRKLASSERVKQGAIKLFSKKTKPSIIQASKADIQQSNFQKNVNRGVSGAGDNSGGKSLVKPVGLLPAPSGKATGAKNVRVNQPKEKTLIKNEGQVGARPITPKKPEAQKLLPAPRIPTGTSLPRTDISAESMRGVKAKRPVTPKPLKPKESIVTPKKKENTPIVKKDGMNIGKYKSSEVLPTNNADFSQRFTPESKIDERTTKMATIEILDKNGKVIDKFSFSRNPSSEKQIQDMADALIREKVLGKYFNSKEFDSSLKEFKNLPVNTSSKNTLVKPSPKPIVKNPLEEKRLYNSNLTESEMKNATKGAKTKEEYNKMATNAGMKKVKLQNDELYKGKIISYERNGKKYTIEYDKNPDTFVLAKEMVDDAKIPNKITSPIVKNLQKTGDMETKKLIEEAKGFSVEPILKEFNEKSKYFKNSGIKVKSLKLDGNIDDVVKNGKKLKEGWSYAEQKSLGKTEKTQGWYIQEPLNPIGGGKTITAIRADGVGIRVSLPDGYKSIEGTVARDFVENVIDRNPFIDTEIKGVVTKQLTPQSNAKQQGIKPKSPVKNPESSQTQANGPRVIGKMGKVETKTSPQSATSYEAGMRRPFTLGSNKPLVKRATDIDSGEMDFNKAMRDEMSNTKRTPPSKEEYSVTATLKKIKKDLENAKSKKEILDTTLAIDSYIKRGLDSTAYPESVMNIANRLHDMARAKRNTVMEKIDTNGLKNAIKEMEDRLSVYKQKGLQGKMLENYKDQISALKILKSHAESPGDYGLYEITSENTFKKDLSNTLSYMKKRFEDRAFGIDPFIDRQMKQIKEYYTRK